jgi:ATP-binding cassette subfamily B protein
MEAVRAADLYETIMGFPDRFDALIGEKGITLSGGQRQRLALARSFLMSAPIMILDDPLSQVDTDTAATILAAIQNLSPKRTTIMVSHRLNHVRYADLILVLEDGRITEAGTHATLMSREGFYRNMYHWQEIEEKIATKENADQLRIF